MDKRVWKVITYFALVFGGYVANFNPLLGGVLVAAGVVILAYKL